MTLTYLESAETQQDVERRREHRIDQTRPVLVFEPFTGHGYAGRTCDVSVAGMRLRLPATMNLGIGRFLTLSTGSAVGPRMIDPLRRSLPARVVWVKPDPEDEAAILVGVELYGSAIAAAA